MPKRKKLCIGRIPESAKEMTSKRRKSVVIFGINTAVTKYSSVWSHPIILLGKESFLEK